MSTVNPVELADKVAELVRRAPGRPSETRCALSTWRFGTREAAEAVAQLATSYFSLLSGVPVNCYAINVGLDEATRGSSVLVSARFGNQERHDGDLLLDASCRPYGLSFFSDCSAKNSGGLPVFLPLTRPRFAFSTGSGSRYWLFEDGTCSRQRFGMTGRYPLMRQVFFVTPETVEAVWQESARQLVLCGTFPAELAPRPGLQPLEYGRIHDPQDLDRPLATWADGRVTFPRVISCWHHVGHEIDNIDRHS